MNHTSPRTPPIDIIGTILRVGPEYRMSKRLLRYMLDDDRSVYAVDMMEKHLSHTPIYYEYLRNKLTGFPKGPVMSSRELDEFTGHILQFLMRVYQDIATCGGCSESQDYTYIFDIIASKILRLTKTCIECTVWTAWPRLGEVVSYCESMEVMESLPPPYWVQSFKHVFWDTFDFGYAKESTLGSDARIPSLNATYRLEFFEKIKRFKTWRELIDASNIMAS